MSILSSGIVSRTVSGKCSQIVYVSMLLGGLLCARTSVAAASLSVKWKEQDGQILLETVCYPHRYGSIAYRNCRADAQKQFKGRCAHFTRQLEHATGSQRGEYRTAEKKYCYAARTFRIVN